MGYDSSKQPPSQPQFQSKCLNFQMHQNQHLRSYKHTRWKLIYLVKFVQKLGGVCATCLYLCIYSIHTSFIHFKNQYINLVPGGLKMNISKVVKPDMFDMRRMLSVAVSRSSLKLFLCFLPLWFHKLRIELIIGLISCQSDCYNGNCTFHTIIK